MYFFRFIRLLRVVRFNNFYRYYIIVAFYYDSPVKIEYRRKSAIYRFACPFKVAAGL